MIELVHDVFQSHKVSSKIRTINESGEEMLAFDEKLLNWNGEISSVFSCVANIMSVWRVVLQKKFVDADSWSRKC